MFISVVLGESENSQNFMQVNVNPNCPIRMIYDFIRETFNIPAQTEFDLCDEMGNLVAIYEKDPWEYGTNFVALRTLYFVVLLERAENGKLTNPVLNIPLEFLSSTAQLSELRQKIQRVFKLGTSQKLRPSRARSAAVHVNISTILK